MDCCHRLIISLPLNDQISKRMRSMNIIRHRRNIDKFLLWTCNMISIIFLCSFWSLSTVIAKALITTDYQALNLSLPTAPSELLFSPKQPVRSVNTSAGNRIDVQCNGTRFGYNPNLVDCQSAKSYIYPDLVQRTWKERYTPGLTEDGFPLPFRVMGGNMGVPKVLYAMDRLTLQTDKALCYFQPMLKDGHTVGQASVSQVRSAANTLILECAANPDSPQGGIATNIGLYS